MNTGQTLQFRDEFAALLCGNEFCELDRIDQELQFSQLEKSISDMVSILLLFIIDDIHAISLQKFHVEIDAFTLTLHAFCGEVINDFLNGQMMFIIGFPQEKILDFQKFKFVLRTFFHSPIVQLYG